VIGFNDRLAQAAAHSVQPRDVLLTLPGISIAEQGSHYEDLTGVDWVIGGEQITRLGIDLKMRDYRYSDYNPDLCLETESTDRSTGWTRDTRKRTDAVLWIYRNGWCVLVPFRPLLVAFERNEQLWRADAAKRRPQYPGGENIQTSYRNGSTWQSRDIVVSQALIAAGVRAEGWWIATARFVAGIGLVKPWDTGPAWAPR
jgi:hypothetical protein